MWSVPFCRLRNNQGTGCDRGSAVFELISISPPSSHTHTHTNSLTHSQVERERYETGVRWLHDLLYGLQFSPERVAVVATKMVNDVAR